MDVLGMQRNDIIISVNGRKMPTDPVGAKKLYDELKTADSFKVEFLKDGKIVEKKFNINQKIPRSRRRKPDGDVPHC